MPAETPPPDALINALTDHGWTVVGHGAHHVRLAYGGETRRSLVVPTDPEAPEHELLMSGVLDDLAGHAQRGRHAQAVLDALRPAEAPPVPTEAVLAALSTVLVRYGYVEPDDPPGRRLAGALVEVLSDAGFVVTEAGEHERGLAAGRTQAAADIRDHPGPDPSPAIPAWWAGYREAQEDSAKIAEGTTESPRGVVDPTSLAIPDLTEAERREFLTADAELNGPSKEDTPDA